MKNYMFLLGTLALVCLPVAVSAEDIGLSMDNIGAGNLDTSQDFSLSDGTMSSDLLGSDSSLSDIGDMGSLPDMTEMDTSQTMTNSGMNLDEEKTDLQKYQDAFDQSRELMKNGLPTLETESIDSLRGQLTESMKANASSTLKELMGNSFSSLDSNLFSVSGIPSSEGFSMESLNVHYAEMREAFESASSGISGSLDGASNSAANTNKIGDIQTELENWRNSSAYQSISSQISLSDVFGSLEKQLPSKDTGTGEAAYNQNVASQNSAASKKKKEAVSSAKSSQKKAVSSNTSKLKSAANSWAKSKSKNPVTGSKVK